MDLLDVTLREGEQRPGRRYTVDQKVAAARELDALGVDFVQVGFPVADDRTRKVCTELDLDARTTGIARAIDRDIEAAAAAEVDVVDLFAPTSDRQRERLLGQTTEELESTVLEAVDTAHDTGLDVHFSAMDGFRTDVDVLARLVEQVDTEYVTIADTVGGQTPKTVTDTLNSLVADRDLDRSRIGVHFHDDIGVGTANALVAADWGVGKADVSVAGIGERAGNTSLEEFVVASVLGGGSTVTNVKETELVPRASAILDILDESVPPAKALLGTDVFAHESGLHTAAMLDEPATFEPFDPAQFGGRRNLLFGPASGVGAARRLLDRAGVDATDTRIEALLDTLHAQDETVSLETAVAFARDVAAETE